MSKGEKEWSSIIGETNKNILFIVRNCLCVIQLEFVVVATPHLQMIIANFAVQ